MEKRHWLGSALIFCAGRANKFHRGITAGVVAFASVSALLRADVVPIPNGDFALPDASMDPYATGFFVIPGPPTDWQSAAVAGFPGGAAAQAQAVGVFNNTTALVPWPYSSVAPLPAPLTSLFINNLPAEGQAAFVQAYPGLGIYQDLTGPTATYQTGLGYQLKFGVLAVDLPGFPYTQSVAANAPLEAMLYYRDGGGNQVPVGTPLVITNTAAVEDQNNLTMFEIDVPAVQLSDAWQGKQIGIAFFTPSGTDPALEGGNWDIGNLSLASGVPEPASLAMLACGLAGIILRRRGR